MLTSLSFDSRFQAGLLCLLMTDSDFFSLVIEDLEPQHFSAGEGYIKLFKVVKNRYKKARQHPTLKTVKNLLIGLKDTGHFSDPELYGLNSILEMGQTLVHSEYEFVKEHVFDFLRKQTVALAFAKSIEYFDKNDYDQMYDIMNKAYRKSYGVGESLGIEYLTSSVAERYMESPRIGVWSTGYERFDAYQGGGFAEKECYSVLSSTGRGKTALLCNFAVASLRAKRRTLFVTLEMPERVIQQRSDSIMLGFSATEISENPELQVDLDRMIKKLKAPNFTVKEFQRGAITTQQLENYLDRYCDEIGKPDTLIVDWLGCFKFPVTRESKKHELMGEAADHLVNMSRKYTCSLITAHQTNRGAVGNDEFGYDSVSESFASLFGMDGVFGLGASDKAKDAGKRTLKILKNRNGPDSVFVKLQGDLPSKPLTFKFAELDEEEEKDLLDDTATNKKK